MFTASLGYGANNESKIFIFEFDGLKGFYNDIIKGNNKCELDDLSRLDKGKVLADKLKQYYFICTGDYKIEGTGEFLGMDGVDYSHRKKNLLDDNAKYHCLVIDGDVSNDGVSNDGLCDAGYVHSVIKKLGYNNFVYTSYSNGISGNKWRAVVECELLRCDIEGATRALWEEMQSNGVNVKFASENKDTVRIWFFGKSWGDGYADYGWFEGLPFVWKGSGSGSDRDADEAGAGAGAGESAAGDEESLDDFEYKMRNWSRSTGRHESIIKFIYGLCKDTHCNKTMVIKLTQMAMGNTPAGDRDDRWMSEFVDIERNVIGAINRIKEGGEWLVIESSINIEDVDVSDSDNVTGINALPWPPGMLGKLADNAYDMALYQYKEVSLVCAVGLIAGIAGRKFNVSKTGLNVYLTLIMETGMGKDFIKDFINGQLLSFNKLGKASSFMGFSRYTGPKPLIVGLESARSQVCVFTEAGILMKDGTGDQSGRVRKLLELYSCSGKNQYTGKEGYSVTENNIPSLRAAALSIISESTPETLHSAFSSGGCLENGHLPRQSIFRVIGDKPYMNFSAKEKLDDDINCRLEKLISTCSEVQSCDNPDVFDFTFSDCIVDDVKLFSKECVNIENNNRGNVKGIMANRMFMKAMKYAAIATVINYEHNLCICSVEWEWAKQLVSYEFSCVDKFFQGSDFSDTYHDLISGVVGKNIVKIATGKYAGARYALNARQRKDSSIPYKCITQCLRNCKQLKFDKKFASPIDGLELVLRHMVKMGYLVYISSIGDKYNKDGYLPRDEFVITDLLKETIGLYK